MAKPKNKKELIAASQEQYQKLFALIDSLSKDQLKKEFPKGTLNRNVRDVIAHLHHWHLLILGWHKVGMTGEKPDMPAKGYTWKTLPDLNKVVLKKYQKTSYNQSVKLLNKSYAEVQQIIHQHSNKELFEKKKYAWTGSTSLAAYLIANSVSHYNWAIKLIKKGTKNL